MNGNTTPAQVQAFANVIDSVWESFPLTGEELGAADFDQYFSMVVDAVQASKYCSESDCLIGYRNMAWFILIGMEIGRRIERSNPANQQDKTNTVPYTGI